MGQPITVAEKRTSDPWVVRFEINRSITGTGHERYATRTDAAGDRWVDELARRLFDMARVDAIHIYSNVITVDLAKGSSAEGMADVIRELFIHYRPGVKPPSDEELIAQVEG